MSLAAIGAFSCLTVQGPCFEIPTEDRGRPMAGTARAAYCGPIDHWYRWILFPAAAIVIGAVASLLLSRAQGRRTLAVCLVLILLVVNFLIVDALNYYVEI